MSAQTAGRSFSGSARRPAREWRPPAVCAPSLSAGIRGFAEL